MEVYYGLIHFISCLYILPVIPKQMRNAGYNASHVIISIGITCGLGSIFGGLVTNLPFVLAPPTAVSIFLAVYLQSNGLGPLEGNVALLISGALTLFFFWRPLGNLFARLVPLPIQVGTVAGIGLLTALAGAVEIDIVRSGTYTIVEQGKLTNQVIIAMIGIVLICVALHRHVKGAFCLGLIICSVLYWIDSRSWPQGFAALPRLSRHDFNFQYNANYSLVMSLELIFLYMLYLNGIVRSLSNLAQLQKEDGSTPRARWLYVFSGLATIVGGLFTSAPVLISPESSAAIKSGAKTGLSSLVCGLLFLLSIFFAPIFEAIPAAGTSPILMIVGIILFQDVSRINWKQIDDAVPAFAVLFFIPFSYSIIYGVAMGYLFYWFIGVFTGKIFKRTALLLRIYWPEGGERMMKIVERVQEERRKRKKKNNHHNNFNNNNDNNNNIIILNNNNIIDKQQHRMESIDSTGSTWSTGNNILKEGLLNQDHFQKKNNNNNNNHINNTININMSNNNHHISSSPSSDNNQQQSSLQHPLQTGVKNRGKNKEGKGQERGSRNRSRSRSKSTRGGGRGRDDDDDHRSSVSSWVSSLSSILDPFSEHNHNDDDDNDEEEEQGGEDEESDNEGEEIEENRSPSSLSLPLSALPPHSSSSSSLSPSYRVEFGFFGNDGGEIRREGENNVNEEDVEKGGMTEDKELAGSVGMGGRSRLKEEERGMVI